MRTRLLLGTALILVAATTTGCFDFASDSGILNQQGSGGGSGTGGTGGGTGGTGGTTTTAPPECVPSNGSTPVEDTCGVFVSESKGSDKDGAGTKASPVKTLGKAIELATAKSKPVYMCGETFTGPIQIGASALVYGALDCAQDWKYAGDGGRTLITAAADKVPLQVQASASIEMYDINVTSLDATMKGGSSIALISEGGTSLKLVRCDVTAGSGAAGADAEPVAGKGKDGVTGFVGVDACTSAQAVTPEAPVSGCGADDSFAGPAGNGGTNTPTAGGNGEPGGDVNPNLGGAEGQANPCGNGKDGVAGTNGGSGAGAPPGAGALTAETGYMGVAGADGEAGKPAQGGGGGGGSKGGTGANKCMDGTKAAGASGGTGGSGGCGGQGGKGGKGGGASIAIATFGATLAFDTVKLVAKDGGRGGNGADGQQGGSGAEGGLGGKATGFSALNPGCKGGFGGDGGKGGMGGGGLGGHSVGVAYKGTTAPDLTGATITTGKAGDGGDGDGAAGKGASGIAKDTQTF